MASTQRLLLHLSKNTLISIARKTQPLICHRHILTQSFRSSYRVTHPPTRSLFTSVPRYAAPVNQLPSKPTVILQTPSPEYIENEELDVELMPPEQVKLVITDRAAEQLRSIATRESNPEAALRILVESGGCHGYQYKLELAKEYLPDDYHFSHPTIRPSNILVDVVSLSLLNGSTVDFATELIGSSFRVDDNPQSKGNGCGCGISWELKE